MPKEKSLPKLASPSCAPRLHVEADLRARQTIGVSHEQAHYLQHVMRLTAGGGARLFNGRDGEWQGSIAAVSKRALEIAVEKQLRPQAAEPDLQLCCAPIKKAHFDYMIEKATELGVGSIQPMLTARTQVREINSERCRSIAIEAAKQSERLSVPAIQKPALLKELAARWPDDRSLIVCAEWGEALPVQEAFAQPRIKSAARAAIMIGPEGGFAPDELEMLRKIKAAIFIRLGPRILRADTAAIAALGCWQAMCGDWRRDKLSHS